MSDITQDGPRPLSPAAQTRNATIEELVRRGWSVEQAEEGWYLATLPGAEGGATADAAESALRRQNRNPSGSEGARIDYESMPGGRVDRAEIGGEGPQTTDQAAGGRPGDFDDVRDALEEFGYSPEAVEEVLRQRSSSVVGSLEDGEAPDLIARRLRLFTQNVDADIQAQRLAAGQELTSEYFQREGGAEAVQERAAQQILDQRLQEEWGALAEYNGMELDQLIDMTVYRFAQHGADHPNSILGRLAERYTAGDIDASMLLGALSNDTLMGQVSGGYAVLADILPAALTKQEIRYSNDAGGVTTTYVNPVLFDQVAANLGGDQVLGATVLGAVHKSLGSPTEWTPELEQHAPVVAMLLNLNGTVDTYNRRVGMTALVDFANEGQVPVGDPVSFLDDGGDIAGPDATLAGRFGGGGLRGAEGFEYDPRTEMPFQGRRENEEWIAAGRPGAPERQVSPFAPTAPLDVQLPPIFGIQQAALFESSQFSELVEQYGRRELAVVAYFDRDLADVIYTNGGPRNEEEVARAFEIFNNLGSERIRAAGLFNGLDADRIQANLFNVGGEYGATAAGAGRTVTATVPDPDSTRLAYKELYRQLLLAEPSEAQLSAFVASIESDTMANASAAAAAVREAAGNFWQNTGREVTQDEATRIIKQYGVDVRASAYAALEASDAYAKLYAAKPDGMDPLQYAAAYAQEVGQYLEGGEAASEDFLSAQRRGMMIGGAAGSDVAASNAVLSEEGLQSEGVQERWARAARRVAEYF